MDARQTSLNSAASTTNFFGFFSCVIGLSLWVVFNKYPFLTALLNLGFFLLGFFFFTVTRIKTDETVLKYRRWSQWYAVPYSEIVECGADGMYGYIRLRRYIFPWGKIYFLRPYSPESLLAWDQQTIKKIRAKAGIAP
jgi:hypothetical protein